MKESETLHTASQLLSIVHEVTSIRKYIYQIWFPHRESFLEDEEFNVFFGYNCRLCLLKYNFVN